MGSFAMLSVAASATAYMPAVSQGRAVTGRTSSASMTESWQTKAQSVGLAAALAFGAATQAQAGPFTRSEIASLTYEQVKGTGLANTCPTVEGGGKTSIKLNGKNKIDEFCLEGDLIPKDGKLTFIEKDGIDYAPTTVQLPGGERVPFLFTVKNLVAKADNSPSSIEPGLKLAGNFKVPSYRTGLFLDPKGRGTTTGYDQAIALPALQAGGDESLFNENNKKFDVLGGSIELKVTDVNEELGEIGGVFVHKQPSDTDLGSKAPKELLLKGNWFATVQ